MLESTILLDGSELQFEPTRSIPDLAFALPPTARIGRDDVVHLASVPANQKPTARSNALTSFISTPTPTEDFLPLAHDYDLTRAIVCMDHHGDSVACDERPAWLFRIADNLPC